MKNGTPILILILLFTNVCGALENAKEPAEDDDPPAKNSPIAVHKVLPSQTDSEINTFSGVDPNNDRKHYRHWTFFNASVPEKHELVIFLPGTGGHGQGASGGAFNNLVANEGFHLISLAYPNNISMTHIKGGLKQSDADSFLKARENIIYGKNPFPGFDVNEANSIYNRLLKLLRYLTATFPQEHWNQYLTEDGSLNWSKFILTGQSQGGGHAALLGMQHKVERVLMFGAPKDHAGERPAKWLSGPSATPLDRFFCFNHKEDDHNGATYAQQLENYHAMKLMPKYTVINVDEAHSPFEHTRLLTSTRPQGSPHTSVIGDPVYVEVWKYMLEEPVR